ncbi:hypothetical protein [Saccharopolyspora pogona]|uniref:hypothetical protein n=1 Tax=Saccharopolyspora pogona TaxID=333966 RepID=UPI0016858D87|nr:hypothetical protein [Saccharopolyspora pogona]
MRAHRPGPVSGLVGIDDRGADFDRERHQPRIDVIFATVYDQASIPTDPGHGPVVDVLTGTPAASPVARTDLPDGR